MTTQPTKGVLEREFAYRVEERLGILYGAQKVSLSQRFEVEEEAGKEMEQLERRVEAVETKYTET